MKNDSTKHDTIIEAATKILLGESKQTTQLNEGIFSNLFKKIVFSSISAETVADTWHKNVLGELKSNRIEMIKKDPAKYDNIIMALASVRNKLSKMKSAADVAKFVSDGPKIEKAIQDALKEIEEKGFEQFFKK